MYGHQEKSLWPGLGVTVTVLVTVTAHCELPWLGLDIPAETGQGTGQGP